MFQGSKVSIVNWVESREPPRKSIAWDPFQPLSQKELKCVGQPNKQESSKGCNEKQDVWKVTVHVGVSTVQKPDKCSPFCCSRFSVVV